MIIGIIDCDCGEQILADDTKLKITCPKCAQIWARIGGEAYWEKEGY